MKFLQKAFNKHLISKVMELGHKPAPKPDNENSRLKDLKDLKIIEENIEKSKRFSSFPRLAAMLTECDKAAINIVDDTSQHCKVNFGMDAIENMMVREIPRELSVCAHVLNNASEPLVINDLTKDSRTKHVFELNNPIINKTFPKFYAGSPIITSNGYILGSFCVFNSEPKALDNSKVEGLRMLADQFIDLYESTKDEYKREVKPGHTKKEKVNGEYFSSSTVLFCDFVGFTQKTEKMQPGELVEILDTFFDGFDKIIERFELKKVKTIGDAYMAVGGIPDLNSNHSERTVMAAKEIINFVTGINFQQKALGNESWYVRIGIHSGPVIAGSTTSNFDIWGDTVNIASRLESSGEKMKINISEQVKNLLPTSVEMTDKKMTNLKNKGEFLTYFVDTK